ncbi:hypothetical protein AGDE_13215 [Angomonas deanei]|uniref:Uncharacterized protein n=1 Tax=Angomonas deanei TaxID=59799 RepID=A0A7G2CTA1_9TRYP|nr:hypothetical protein AGDE_13215 [Angomonas deanei]CAD2221452.1 hypothetical protein, conserved [Angomonas deanei]|eukprot:EPY22613.1 hypothetical protein AGDE_13215 [Angomonas deanei]
MFSRLPLPIRFLHPSPFRPSDGARLLPVYKHTGLPVFAQKEVKRCTAPSQLYYPFSSTEGTSPHDQQDLSDSLSGRVRDALPPGPTPYYALPQVSPAVLAHLQKSSRAKGNNSVERLNRYTAEQRGVSLYVNSKSDLLLVQRMSEMGLVYKKYRVLCHVPVSLGKAAIAALQQKEQSMHQHAVHRPNLVLSGKRQREQNGTEGISFAGAADFGKQKKSWDIPSPHPYVKGGLIDEQRQLLLHHGRLQCRLCMGRGRPLHRGKE